MEYKVLYYPGFHPDALWLRKVLLFTDEVVRIVPDDVVAADPPELKFFEHAAPGAFNTISPDRTHDAQVGIVDARLEQALSTLRKPHAATISAKKKNKKRTKIARRIEIIISPDGGVQVGGHTFLHQRKLNERLLHALERNGLLADPAAQALSPTDFISVDEDAAMLILVAIAESVARRTGLDAVTERPLANALAALRRIATRTEGTPLGGPEGSLLSASARLFVPDGVGAYSEREYEELRHNYRDLRRAFSDLARELSSSNGLERVGDWAEREKRIESLVGTLNAELHDFKKTRFSRRIGKFANFGVNTVLTIGAVAIDPTWAILPALGSVAMTFYDKYCASESAQPHERVLSLLAGVQRDVARTDPLRLLHAAHPRG